MKILDKILNRKSKTSFVLLYSYETIALKLYLEIAENLDFKKLIVTGDTDDKACAIAWDKIIQRNFEVNGGYDYLNYVDLMNEVAFLIAESNFVKARILKLITLNIEIGIVIGAHDHFVRDTEIIEELAEQGYKIDISSPQNYSASLNTALIRVDHLQKRIKLKIDDIGEMNDNEGVEKKTVSFDSIMAFLSSQFPHVPEDITLSRYNEMIKVLKEKNKRSAKIED